MEYNTDIRSLEDNKHYECCMCWLAQTPKAEGAERAALIKSVQWPQGSSITISFLDGYPQVQQKVRAVAEQWIAPGMANLVFIFRNNTHDTDIRISFNYRGSWSVLGTSCREITDTSQPTMNFGWLSPSSTDEEIYRVVLHEFGHALGLTHEHLNPAGGIKWNKDQVKKDLSGPPNNWTEDMIDTNMFRTPAKDETNYTQVDKQSIMMYPIPAKWTLDGYSVGLNSKLSETDKNFIRSVYP